MRTTSTKQLPSAMLKLPYSSTAGIVNAVYDYSVELVEPFSSNPKRCPSHFLWLLRGSVIFGSSLWLMDLFPQESWSVHVTGLSLAVLSALIAPTLLYRKRVANAKVKLLDSPLCLDAQKQPSVSLITQGDTTRTPILTEVQEKADISPDSHEHQFVQEMPGESEPQHHQPTTNIPGMRYECLQRLDGSISFLSISSAVRDLCELEPMHIQDNPDLLFDLIHADDRLQFRRSITLSTKTLQPWKWEGRVHLASGKIKWIQASAELQLQANGDLLWNGVAFDISERKQTESELKEREQWFQATFEQAGIAIAQVAANGQLLRVNQKLCEITGYNQAELLSKTLVELTHPEEQAATERYLDEFFSNQRQTLNIEQRYIHKIGFPLWANTTVSLVCEPMGVPKYCLCVLEDITQRKHAEEEFQQANREHTHLFEGITEAFLAVDRQWRFTYINSRTEQFLSRKAEELLGKSLWDEFPQIVGSSFEQQFRRSVEQQFCVKFEAFYPPLHRWLRVRTYPYTGGLSVYLSDITERKQSEEALLESSRLSTLAGEVGVALANGGALLTILQHCTEAMVQQLHAASATIWTLNPASLKLEQQAASGQHFPLQPDLIERVAQGRKPYHSQEGIETCSSGRRLTPYHFSGYPLVVEDRLIGVITVLSNQPLSEEAEIILGWVSNAIAIAIDRHWARTELLSRRESLLFGIANQIRNSLELDRILETTVHSVRNLFGIDRCHFLWYRTDEGEPYWQVVNEAKHPDLPSHIDRHQMPHIRRSQERLLRQPMIQVDDVETLKNPRLRKFLRSMGYTSLLSIPIKTQGGAIGVISCGHCREPRPWDKSEVELLQAVVAQLAIALEQAELYDRARQAASEAQAKAQQLERTIKQLRSTQAQLVQSEKMSSLGQLVAGIAHEINNPINFIHGNLAYASAYMYDVLNLLRLYQEHYSNPVPAIVEQSELINIDFISTDLPKLLGSMQRGTDRIRLIVQSLQKFSRADEARMKRVDVHEGIESTLLILQHRLTAKGKSPEIKIYKEYSNLPLIECYPGELNQVFMNILLNAIEALKPLDINTQGQASLLRVHASPAITIRTRLLDCCESRNQEEAPLALSTESLPHLRSKGGELSRPNSQRVVIQIADNGPGMSELVRSRLFDPFFTTKPVGQGTGLGLSISYQIVVEHHHGVLTCTSIPGKGTEFWIEIPIEQTG